MGQVDRQPRGRAASPERAELHLPRGPGPRGGAAPGLDPAPRSNGGRPRVNEYIYDGISVLQPEPGTVPYFPIIDAIQEFKVVTNSPPAEFGRFNGGVINLTTKSGSNEFHGSAWEFLRNEDLNARNLFAPATAANPDKPALPPQPVRLRAGRPDREGPARSSSWTTRGRRQSIGRVRISTVPTALQRQGIFTERVAGQVPALYDPATTRPVAGGGSTREPFPGNTIPGDRFDPVAAGPPGRYPLPNLPGHRQQLPAARATRTRTWTSSTSASTTAPRRSDQLFARFSYSRDFTDPVTPLPDGSGNLTTGAIGPHEREGASRPC